MGNWLYASKPPIMRRLCDDVIDGNSDFMIEVYVYAARTTVDLSGVMEHLQHTRPLYSYTVNKHITLIYSPKKKPTSLHSNVSGEIISSITYEVANFLIRNNMDGIQTVDVSISIIDSDKALENLLILIDTNKFTGTMTGIDILSSNKIKEQFDQLL